MHAPDSSSGLSPLLTRWHSRFAASSRFTIHRLGSFLGPPVESATLKKERELINSMPTYAVKVIDFVAEWFADSMLQNAVDDANAFKRFIRSATFCATPIARLRRHLMHEPDQYKRLIANGPHEPLVTPLLLGSTQGIRPTHFECLLDHASLLEDLSELWKRCERGDTECIAKRFGIWRRLVPDWNLAQSLPAKVRRECALANVTLPYYYDKKPSERTLSVVGSLGTKTEHALIVATLSDVDANRTQEFERLIQAFLENSEDELTPVQALATLSLPDGDDYESWLSEEEGVVTWNGETFDEPLRGAALKAFTAIWEATRKGNSLSPADVRKAARAPNCGRIRELFRRSTGDRKPHPVFGTVIVHEGTGKNTRYRVAEPQQKIPFCLAGALSAHLNRPM